MARVMMSGFRGFGRTPVMSILSMSTPCTPYLILKFLSKSSFSIVQTSVSSVCFRDACRRRNIL